MRDDVEIPEPPPVVEIPTQPNVSAAPDLSQQEEFPADDEDVMPEQTMFTDFVMNIASSAFIYLGLVEHPGTGRRQVDIMAAKETIDLLMLLREKTNGNLTPGEARFFDELLAELKTQFVSMRR
ncbi:MAG: DUF1844 domain-containing protein [Blastocatellia bacterium]